MRKGKSSNSDGLLVDTIYYRYKGVRLESGDLVGHDTDNESGGDDEGRQPGLVEEVEVSVEVRLRKTYDGDAAGEGRAFALDGDGAELRVVDFTDRETIFLVHETHVADLARKRGQVTHLLSLSMLHLPIYFRPAMSHCTICQCRPQC